MWITPNVQELYAGRQLRETDTQNWLHSCALGISIDSSHAEHICTFNEP